MLSKKSIRVVKREQRELFVDQQEASECGLKAEREARRAMFKTITLWIEEQKEIKKHSRRRLVLLDERVD
jgi:hypothetical protein